MIRQIQQEDIPYCADILCGVYNNELWQNRWSRECAIEYLTDFLRMPKFLGFVIEEDGMILGALFAREKVWWSGSEVYIEELFIRPDCQQKGYGSLLLQRVEDHVRKHGLAGITLSTNRYAPAPRFYKKNGFVDCEHVLFMCKEIHEDGKL